MDRTSRKPSTFLRSWGGFLRRRPGPALTRLRLGGVPLRVPASGRANAVEEFFDFVPQVDADPGKRPGRLQDLARGRLGFAGTASDMFDVFGDIEGATGSGLDAMGDVLGGRALFLDCGGNRGGDLADALDRQPDRLDRLHGFARGALHVDDMRADLIGGLGGLTGKSLDLLRNHGKAAARIAGARGL